MVYEVISPRPHGSETFVGLHTEYPECIDPLSVQEAMLSGGNKITFKGTEKEYEAVKKKLAAKVKVTIIKEQKTEKENNMVKTDFKNTYEAFMHCDKNKLAKEFAAMYSDNEEQTAAVKEIDRAFARMETVTPKAVNPDEQSIIVVCKDLAMKAMTLSVSK